MSIAKMMQRHEVQEYFRGQREENLKDGIREMKRALEQDDYDITNKKEVILKGLNTLERESLRFSHEKDFRILVGEILELSSKFNDKFQLDSVEKKNNNIRNRTFYKQSISTLNTRVKAITKMGEQIIDKDNPSVKLAQFFLDSIE